MDTKAVQFEWDDHKRTVNVIKHGLDLADATELFDGRPNFDFRHPAAAKHDLSGLAWSEICLSPLFGQSVAKQFG